MASWRPLGTSWAAVGRQMAILVFFGMVQRQKLKKRTKTCYFNNVRMFFGQGFGFDVRLLFACVARVQRSSQERKS